MTWQKRRKDNHDHGSNGDATIVSKIRHISMENIRDISYLKMKHHLHDEDSLIAPPKIGPNTNANARTMETAAAAFGIFSGFMSSKMMIMQEEKTPAAPMPLKARKTILASTLATDQMWILTGESHSCVVVCAAPHAPAHIVKVATEAKSTGFRPTISLSLETMIKNPWQCISFAFVKTMRDLLTHISEQVSCYDPAAEIEAMQIVRNGYQGSVDDGDFDRNDEEANAYPRLLQYGFLDVKGTHTQR